MSDDRYEISADPARIGAAIAASLNFGAYDRASGAQGASASSPTTPPSPGSATSTSPSARGRGLATALATAARDHLESLGVRRVLLATHDAHGVYAKVGFEPLEVPGHCMSLVM